MVFLLAMPSLHCEWQWSLSASVVFTRGSYTCLVSPWCSLRVHVYGQCRCLRSWLGTRRRCIRFLGMVSHGSSFGYLVSFFIAKDVRVTL
jgi:hypothetical protein